MKTSPRCLNKVVAFCVLLGFASWVTPARADLKQIKAYKEAYPDTAPKCINCHVDEKPKKDDGQHDPSDYGKAVLKAAGSEKPTVDTYKQVGSIENFKK